MYSSPAAKYFSSNTKSGKSKQSFLLRAALNANINVTPVAVCMTRMPHIKTCHKDLNILEAAALLQDFAIDSLPVVDDQNEGHIIGTITKSTLLNFIIQEARNAEVNR